MVVQVGNLTFWETAAGGLPSVQNQPRLQRASVLRRMGVVALWVVIPDWEFFVLIWMSNEHPLPQFAGTGWKRPGIDGTHRS